MPSTPVDAVPAEKVVGGGLREVQMPPPSWVRAIARHDEAPHGVVPRTQPSCEDTKVTDAARKPGTDGVEVGFGEGANLGLGLGRGLGTVAPQATPKVAASMLTVSTTTIFRPCTWRCLPSGRPDSLNTTEDVRTSR